MLKALRLQDSGSIDLKYSRSFGCQEYKLLEVDDSLLQQIVDGGVSIKGCANDEAVLCSSSTTYAVKFVSTSNSVFLAPPTNNSLVGTDAVDGADAETTEEDGETAAVVATVSGFIELVQVAPRIEKLQTLLAQNPYREVDEIMDTEGGIKGISANEEWGLYTWDYLVSNVQASEEELRLALKELGAVQIGRHWRTVDRSFMTGLLDVLLLNAVSHDWDLEALSESHVISTMRADGFSDKLVQHCLATYGVEIEGLDARTWSLDHTLICVHYAKGLLPRKGRWSSEEFMAEWQKLLPVEIMPSLDMLRGEALVEKLGSHSWLKGFSRSCVCQQIPQHGSLLYPKSGPDGCGRLAVLRKVSFSVSMAVLCCNFRHALTWRCLLSDLRVPGLSVEAMLLKYTRKTQPDASCPPV